MLRAIAVVLALACTEVSSTYARDLQERWASSTQNLVPGAEEVNSAKLAKDASGNVILGGNSDDEEVWAWIVQKYDSQTGALLWKERFVPPAPETLTAVATDANGDVFALGWTILRKYRGTDGSLLWETSRAGFSASSMAPPVVDAAGDVLVTGAASDLTPAFTGDDVLAIKFSGADGAIRWQTRWTTPSNRDDHGYAIQIGPTGEVFVAGSYYDGVFSSIVTLKLRADNGEIIWVKTAPSERRIDFRALACGENGNVAVAGAVSATPDAGDDIYVATYAGATGDLAWEKRYRGPNPTATYRGINALAMDADGNVILSGFSYTSEGSFFAGKYAAADGGMLWERVVPSYGQINSIRLTANGDVVVGGNLEAPAPAYRDDFYLARYQGTDGAIVWDEQIVGPFGKDSILQAIGLDAGGSIYAAGTTTRGADNDYCVAKYSVADGANTWIKTFDGLKHGEGRAQAVAIDGNGDLVSTGYLSNGENTDIYTEKRDGVTGVPLWTRRFKGTANGADEGRAVATDAEGNVYIAGFTYNGVNQDGYLAKLRGADGELIWQTIYAPIASQAEVFNEMSLAPDGGVVVHGTGASSSLSLKFSGNTGAVIWEKTTTGLAPATNRSLCVDANGDVVLGGSVQVLGGNYLTVKRSGATGEVLWQVQYNRPPNDTEVLQSVAVDGNGDVVVTGNSARFGQGQLIYTAKYAAGNGALLWERSDTFGSFGETLLTIDGERNVYVIPRAASSLKQRILKISPAGALLWERGHSLPTFSSSVTPVSSAIDSFGNLVVAGTYGAGLYISTYAPATGDQLTLRRNTGKLVSPGLGRKCMATGANGLLAVCEYSNQSDVGRYLTRALITNTGPVITLAGTAQLSIEAGSLPYEDAGAIVADVEDPSLVPTLTENTVQPGVPGNYHVTWSVTDSDGVTATATRLVTVVDTTAPVIASIGDISATTMELAGAAVSFNLSATDVVGVSELTSVPASGSVFPLGTTEVIISAQDAAGNASTSQFFVTVNPAGPLHQVVARSGGEVPGAGVDPRIPAGAKWRGFQSPALSATGEVAFVGSWTGANSREKGFGLFRNDILLAANRDESGTALFKSMKDPVFRDGTSELLVPVMRAGVAANADSALLEFPSQLPATPVILAAESEQPIPDSSARISTIVAAAGTPTRAMIVAKLAGPGIGARNNLVAYAVETGKADVIVASTGRLLGANLLGALRFLQPVVGTLGHGRNECHDSGARFIARFDDASEAIVRWSANDGWTTEASTGWPTGADGAEDLAWRSFGAAVSSTRDGADFAFRARVAPAAATSKAAVDSIFWRQSTGMKMIARKDLTSFSDDGSVLVSVSDPVLSNDGGVLAFSGKVKSGAKTVAAVIACAREGEPRVIARAGMPAPGLPAGVIFKSFKSLAAPSGVGGPIFVAGLGGKPGYGQSVWLLDRQGLLRCILRAGETIGADRLKSFRVLEAVSGNSGSTRAFNDKGELVWLATFERGETAVVKTALP